MTEVASLHVASRACYLLNISKEPESEQIFTIIILQFKTGVRLPLTSSVKELEQIYTFGIKNWLKPGWILVDDNEKHLGLKPAMWIPNFDSDEKKGLGLCTGLKHDLEQPKKRKPFKLCKGG